MITISPGLRCVGANDVMATLLGEFLQHCVLACHQCPNNRHCNRGQPLSVSSVVSQLDIPVEGVDVRDSISLISVCAVWYGGLGGTCALKISGAVSVVSSSSLLVSLRILHATVDWKKRAEEMQNEAQRINQTQTTPPHTDRRRSGGEPGHPFVQLVQPLYRVLTRACVCRYRRQATRFLLDTREEEWKDGEKLARRVRSF